MVNFIITKLLGKVFGVVMKILIDFVVAPIMNIIYIVFVTSISFYVYNASTLLLSITDFLFDMFRMFAGVSDGLYFDNLQSGIIDFTNDKNGVVSNDLLIQLITSEQVIQAFLGVFTAGLFLVMVCSFMAIIKQEFNMEKANSKAQVIGAALKSMISMILVPAICIMGMFLANQVLKLIDTATGGSENLTISGVIFSAATVDAYYGKELDYMISLTSPLESGLKGSLAAVVGTVMDSIAELIDEDYPAEPNKFIDKTKKLISTLFGMEQPKFQIEDDNVLLDASQSAVINGKEKNMTRAQIAECENQISAFKQYISTMYTYKDYHYINSFAKNSTDEDIKKKYFDGVEFAGYYAKTVGTTQGKDEAVALYKLDEKGEPSATVAATISIGVEEQVKGAYSASNVFSDYYTYRVYYNAYQVSADFHVARINYLLIFLATGAIIKALFGATLGLMMRVYQGATLFIIMPAVIGISPLDEGGAFNRWKTQFISQVTGAYSSILAVNLFLMLCGWFMNINIAYLPGNLIEQSVNLSGITYITVSFLMNNNVVTSIFKLLFIVTGAFMIQDFSKFLADIFGIFDVMSDGNTLANNIKGELKKAANVMAGVAETGVAIAGSIALGVATAGVGTAATAPAAFGGLAKVLAKAPKAVQGAAKLAKGAGDKAKFLKSRLGDKAKFIKGANGKIDPKQKKLWNKKSRELLKSDDWKSFKKDQKDRRKEHDRRQSRYDDLGKAEEQFNQRIHQAAQLQTDSQLGFSPFNLTARKNLLEANEEAIRSSLSEDQMREGINAQYDYNEAKQALEDFDREHSDDEELSDEAKEEREVIEKHLAEKEAALSKTLAHVPTLLGDKSEDASKEVWAAQQALLDAKEDENLELKTNMKWGLDSLKDMIPGMKVLTDIKSREDKARQNVRKQSEAMDKFVGLLEDMEKDLLKEKEKAHHKEYLTESLRISAQTIKRSIDTAVNKARLEQDENIKYYQSQLDAEFAKSESDRNTDNVERIIGRLQELDYEFDANQVRNYGKLEVTNMLTPIELDTSELNKCTSEKDILRMFKNSVSKIATKNDRLLEKIVADAIKDYKDAADGK